MARAIALATAFILCGTAVPHVAHAAPPDTLEGTVAVTVAVVPLDDASTDAEREVVRSLVNAGLEVYAGEDLALRLAERQVPPPESELASRFSPMTTTIAAGVESFFYRGNESAIETISPMFDLGIAHPEVLARRPDFADQIFSAGIILVRAHQNLGNEENMRAVARLLVKRFPSEKASATTVPPKVIRLLDEERVVIGASGTTVAVRPIVPQGSSCTAYLNGAPAEPAVRYVVAPDEDHYLWLDCGGIAGSVWKVHTRAGSHLEIPVPLSDPLAYRIDPADYTQRRDAEEQLAAIAFWGGFETVVGVSRAPAPSPDALVLVRRHRDGRSEWSDGATQESVHRAILRVFPEIADSVDDEVEPADIEASVTASKSPPDIVTWSVFGGAVLAASTGTFLIVTAENRARLLACSAEGGSGGVDCDGVERVDFSDAEHEQNVRVVKIRRVVGLSAIGLAAGLAGWGVVRLVTRGGSRVSFVPTGPGFALQVEF